MIMEQYYKFRSLNNIRHFLDILINRRLYAARYNDLNDPMEGAYLIDKDNQYTIRLLKNEKYKTRVCSLSKDYKHTLLWSHYADGHKGCCFGISLISENVVPINYVSELQPVHSDCDGRTLLSYKSKLWEYEQEIRLFSKNSYCPVDIHQIIFGYKMPQKDYDFYERLVHSINPDIFVRKIKEEEIFTGF